jgi:diguanylate cyclase (GGDEF)-like protein/PAS domain S-box-containing protein
MEKDMMANRDNVSRWVPWRGMVLYLVIGVAWVAVGDALVTRWVDPVDRAAWQSVKGWLYVLLTGGVAWWLLGQTQKTERQNRLFTQELEQVTQHAPVGIVWADDAGQFLWGNERICAMLGVDLKQLQQLQLHDVLHADDPAVPVAMLQKLRAGEVDHYQAKRQLRRPSDGRQIPVLCSVSYVQAQDGGPGHIACALQDMGEIEAARLALERSDQRLRLALDGNGSGTWDRCLVRDVMEFSPGVARMLRYGGNNLASEFRFEDHLHPEDKERVLEATRIAVQDGTPFSETARLRCYDGVYRWFMARGMRHLDAAGRPERFSGILTDLTTQHLAESRQRLASTVMDHTIEGVVITDAQSRILSVNASFTRLLGYTEAELVGKTPRAFKSGRHDRSFYEAMWSAVQRNGHWRGEIWNRRKNGEVFPEHMSLSAVRDATGLVTHYVCMFTDISDEKAAQRRLEFLAHNDALTGLSNRNWFAEQLDDAVVQARGSGERMAVLQINLDRFKDVNDSYGHSIGDSVLRHVARQVQSAMRPGDILGRMAGDEFAVVVRNLRSAEAASAIARDLIDAVGEPWCSPDGLEVVVGASVGICLYPAQATEVSTLLQGAHAAVYGAKAQGRGVWCFYEEEMTQAARERLALESRLRQAIAQDHMVLYFQPQIDIRSGRIVGAEALVRWNDPDDGLISPAKFIPVAETSGVIGPLGEWVLREACRQGQSWREEDLPALTVAVNVSPRQFHLTDLEGATSRALADSGFPAAQLELEITESALAERTEMALATLNSLRALGVRLAVDDFGTGYSSLAQLKRFPIDVLKIDQGFIRDIPRSADDMAISAAIIAMGHSLGMMVLAEGVETAEQLAFLQERRCDSYQGYLCSRPVPAEAFAELLRAQVRAVVEEQAALT